MESKVPADCKYIVNDCICVITFRDECGLRDGISGEEIVVSPCKIPDWSPHILLIPKNQSELETVK